MVRVEKCRFRVFYLLSKPEVVEEAGAEDLDLVVLTVKVPVWLKEVLMRTAQERRETMSDIVRRALVYYLESLKVGAGGQEEE